MELTIQEIFSVTFSHDYFKNGQTPYFDFRPTPITQKKLKNFHIFTNLLTNEFRLAVGLRKPTDEIVNELRGLGDLHFLILNNHGYLVNYTNLPLIDRIVEIIYLSTGVEGHKIQDVEPVSGSQIIDLLPLNFGIDVEEFNFVELKDKDGEVLQSFDVSAEGFTKLNLSLHGYDEGYFELWSDSELLKKFFATAIDLPEKCIGLLQISGNDVCQMLEDIGESELAEITAEFAAKDCYLEYEIALPAQRKIEIKSLKVDGKGLVDFEEPYEKLMAGTVKLNVFRSTKPIRIKAEFDEPLELIVEYSNLHSEQINEMNIKLPSPDVKRIQTQQLDNDETVYLAPTLVYV